MNTGERIKELRKKAKLTQEQLANLLGVKQVSIQKYENGSIVNLKAETLKRLGHIFEVSPAHIMGWDKFDEKIDTDKIKEELKLIELMKKLYGHMGVELIQNFNELSHEGKRKIVYYSEDILGNFTYKKPE